MEFMFRHEFHPTILREYDIRGIVGTTLFDNDAQAPGVVFALILRENGAQDVVVGHDGRTSSPALERALIDGLISGGMRVQRIGCCPTPMLYHASHEMGAPGAIMVTGSHNPVGYNGFKLMLRNQPFYGEALRQVATLLGRGVVQTAELGSVANIESLDSYCRALLSALRAKGRPLRVVWDNANSSAGRVLEALVARLPGTHVILNAEIDGNFPAHHPDPTLPENMVQLRDAVLHHRADIGFGFDGDADRLGVIDEKGRIIPADMLSLILAQAILEERPGATILGDVKMSQVLFDGIVAAGGKAALCPSGHSEVKNAMRETGAVFAGEMSGHFFFADRWPGFDDGLYAAMRMIDFLAHQSRPVSVLHEALPRAVATPEIRFACPDHRKFQVIDAVIARCRAAGMEMTLIDGIRVREKGGWWLLRASNTQPALVARAEGQDETVCAALLARVDEMLARVGIERPKNKDADPADAGHGA